MASARLNLSECVRSQRFDSNDGKTHRGKGSKMSIKPTIGGHPRQREVSPPRPPRGEDACKEHVGRPFGISNSPYSTKRFAVHPLHGISVPGREIYLHDNDQALPSKEQSAVDHVLSLGPMVITALLENKKTVTFRRTMRMRNDDRKVQNAICSEVTMPVLVRTRFLPYLLC